MPYFSKMKLYFSLSQILLSLLTLSAISSAPVAAMTIEVHGNSVFATGPVEDDIVKFEEALATPGVEQVVLVNSPGGDLWTGMRVGRLIAQKQLKTVAAGFCISSCSIMFMGGKQRTFSDAFRPAQTYIGLHGPHDKITKQPMATLTPQVYAFFKQNMGEQFKPEVINKAFYEMDDAGSLLRVFDAERKPEIKPYHCRSSQTLRKDCFEFKEETALTLGVVTSKTLTPITLPESFKVIPKIFGQELVEPFVQIITDLGSYYKALTDKQCTGDNCRKLFENYQKNQENKALALPVNDGGLGTTSNRDTAHNAFIGAIYSCNHLKDKPARLCETVNVNGMDTKSWYAESEESHRLAVEKIIIPSDKFYANEEFRGGSTTATGFRTQKFNDLTPKSLEGIQTYGTQELAKAIKTPTPPAIIDVSGSNETIPSAHKLVFGGMAYEKAEQETAFEARFAGLLKALSPDVQKPIIFYCLNRDCWLSVNAALRAKKLGYTQVGWYRGGLDSWKAANLPTAKPIVRAVVSNLLTTAANRFY